MHKARQITRDDFKHFEWIVAMDHEVLGELVAFREGMERDWGKVRRVVGEIFGVGEAVLTVPVCVGAWREGGTVDVEDAVLRPLGEMEGMYRRIHGLCVDFLKFLAEEQGKGVGG